MILKILKKEKSYCFFLEQILKKYVADMPGYGRQYIQKKDL